MIQICALSLKQETTMAGINPVGDNARKGAVKDGTQLKNPLNKNHDEAYQNRAVSQGR
jgi:hypothetical protein